MEDYLVAEFKRVDDKDLGLFAIFDGHMGCKVANYLQSHLFNNILKEVMLIKSVQLEIEFLGNPCIHLMFVLFSWMCLSELYDPLHPSSCSRFLIYSF